MKARALPCPDCGARPGELCRGLGPRLVHAGRRTPAMVFAPEVLRRVRQLAGAPEGAERRVIRAMAFRWRETPPPPAAEFRIGCRVNEPDAARIKAAARAAGMTDASFVRGAALFVAELLSGGGTDRES